VALAIGANTNGFGTGGGTQGTTGTISTQVTGSTFYVATMYGNVAGTVVWGDNFGNTYTRVGTEQNNSPQGLRCSLFVCENGAGGAGHQWTQAFADRFSAVSCFGWEVTGQALSGSLDVVAQGNDDSSPYSFPITTVNPAAIIFSIGRSATSSVTTTANGGFTLLDSNPTTTTCYVMYRIVSSAGAYDPAPTFSSNSSTAWITADFKESGGGGVPASITPSCIYIMP
jgi:hypothetical protein